MTTFLGFLMNRANREEFVAPVQAEDAATARMELAVAYPESRYQLLTVYSRTELEHVLAGVDRWPGLPSKVQQPLRTDLSRVKAQMGGLPPLPGQVKATVEKVEESVSAQQPMPAWMQSFVQKKAIQPVDGTTLPVMAAKPAAPRVQALEQAMAAPKKPVSLIDSLRAAKGVAPAKAKAEAPLPAAPVRSGSVIDILKGMHK